MKIQTKNLCKNLSTTQRISKEFVEKKIFYCMFFYPKNLFSLFKKEMIFISVFCRNLKGTPALN
jgi:hypothetical protein